MNEPKQVNLLAGWNELWGRLSASMPPKVSELMLIVGAALVVFSIVKWLWGKHRGSKSKGGGGSMAWTLMIGALLAAPQAVIPMVMATADFVINMVLAALSS